MEFKPGQVVRCQERTLQNGSGLDPPDLAIATEYSSLQWGHS